MTNEGCALPLAAGGAATEVPHYLVAEDLFAACGEQTKAMVPAVVAAVKVGRGLLLLLLLLLFALLCAAPPPEPAQEEDPLAPAAAWST